jgi:prepilin-type N-terminal cleavage/methylation domain-containing protein
MKRDAGFSLIELLVAMAVMVSVSGALLSLIVAGQSIARAQPEAADLQQRARVALQTLGAELALAGAGLDRGPLAGALVHFFPPVVRSDEGGLTVWYVSSREAQGTLAAPLAAGATDVVLASAGNCPSGFAGCAFTPDTTAIVFDARGCRDVVRIVDVSAMSLQVKGMRRGCDYSVGAAIAEGEVRTYRVDPATRQLLRRDEATGATLPVLDNIAAMNVEVLGAGRRARVTLRVAAASASGPMVPDLAISYDVVPPNLQGR